MTEYRTARPDEREQYIDLANYAFRFDFETLMPKVYGKNIESSSIHKVAVDEQGRLAGLVAVLPQQLNVWGSILRTGFVGTVSVHPRARGKGHMKALMNAWLDEIRPSYDLAVLYGGRQRYEYFGFTRGGAQVKYTVIKPNLLHALKQVRDEGVSFRPLFDVKGAEAFAQEMNIRRAAYIERAARQLPAIFRTLHQKAVGVLQNGDLAGYLVTNPAGDDISELAFESPDDIPRAIKAYMTQMALDRIAICTPEYDQVLNPAIASFAESCAIESFFMFNILDFANVLTAFLTLKHRTTGLAPGNFSAFLDGQPVTVRVDESGVTVERVAKAGAVSLSKQEAQTLLLAHHGRYMPVPVPVGWFPLPLFWHKIDSF